MFNVVVLRNKLCENTRILFAAKLPKGEVTNGQTLEAVGITWRKTVCHHKFIDGVEGHQKLHEFALFIRFSNATNDVRHETNV
jgi:hypothetical protein